MKLNKLILALSTPLILSACCGENNSKKNDTCCKKSESCCNKTNATEGLHSNYPPKAENFSAAMKRNNRYESEYPMENELYTTFKYTELKGFDYNNGDGTISRRDPSKVLFENGKYYVWYTHRHTIAPPNKKGYTDVIPSTDWDLSEIWYATSEDGFVWEEQGVAVPRLPEGKYGSRSVSTADILKFKDKYYIYYQAFLEPSGKSGDFCPVSVSVADNPDGPWTPCGESVVPTGKKGDWDEKLIHDPFPLVHNGKIYLYYKSGFNHRDAGGLAIADRPEGPFVKHPLNPVLNSGHEVSLFPFREGVAAMIIKAGNEHNTIQYAKDWVNFEIASFVNMMPNAPAGYIADAFTDTNDGKGITWGLCHYVNMDKTKLRDYSILGRFDCDLSTQIHDPGMKGQVVNIPREVYMTQKLSKAQIERIKKQNNALKASQK